MTNQELQQNYPAYSKSIFSDIMPDNPEVIEWTENVLEKVKGDNILPHYIFKDRDFDIFWGWIIHFFSIIVFFSRNFKKFFNNYENYLDEVGEFMREKDYIQDSRVQINKDLKISLTERLYHKIFVNTRLIDGISTPTNNYNCTDFLPITQGGAIILKVLGYNEDLNEYTPASVNNINIAYYFSDKSLAYVDSSVYNLTAIQAKIGRKIALKTNNGNPYCYIKISYPRLGSGNLPLYIGVFLEGEGAQFITEKSEQQIFDVFSDFRKRGTFKGASLVKKVLEAKKEDNFYADYLSQKNTGWFLNKTSPIFQKLKEEIKIDALIPSSFVKNGLSFNIGIKEQYFLLNQNTSIIFKWIGNVYSESPYDALLDSNGVELLDSNGLNLITPEMVNPTSPSDVGSSEVTFSISVYDKNKNLISDVPLLGDWEYNSTNKVIQPGYSGNGNVKLASIRPKYDVVEGKYYAELPIEILNIPKEAIFAEGTYDKDWFVLNNKFYLFTKKNNTGTHEAYYLRINSIEMSYADINGSSYNTYLENFELGLYLRKLPVTMGFLNIKQYYLCCFKNNSGYTDNKAKEIIDQKILPYNGYRLFLDNSYYKNKITIPLEFVNLSYNRLSDTSIKVKVKIKGGVPPYKYTIGGVIRNNIYLQECEQNLQVSQVGKVNISVIDAKGDKIIENLSYSTYNDLNYKFKLFVDIESNLKSFIIVSGGSETSYNIEMRIINDESVVSFKIIPANILIDITDILPSLTGGTLNNKYIKIIDNKDSSLYVDISSEDFMNFGLDIYDNGEGELIN